MLVLRPFFNRKCYLNTLFINIIIVYIYMKKNIVFYVKNLQTNNITSSFSIPNVPIHVMGNANFDQNFWQSNVIKQNERSSDRI